MFAARLAVGGGVLEIARAAEAAPRPATLRMADLLLDGFAAYFTGGYAAGLPILRRAVKAARRRKSADDELRWLWLAGLAALHIWDDESWDVLSARHVELARAAGVLTELPLALSSRAMVLLFAGELSAAEALVQEAQMVTEATGDNVTPYGALGLAALRADQADGVRTHRGHHKGCDVARGRHRDNRRRVGQCDAEQRHSNYAKAMITAQRAAEHATDIGVSAWGTVELIVAAVRGTMMDTAARALSQLREMTSASGTDWALGVEARSRALLSDGAEAERLYREAIERLGCTRMRTELARAHLLYGEWLRRERRRTDARAQLRTAHEMFDAMGTEAFAARARRELLATGERARTRAAGGTGPQLTPQEAQIARLARDGLTNPEIGTRLFISAKTVQHHLSNVFTKLGISSRSQLH